MSARIGPRVPETWERVGQGGPRPFTSYVEYRRPDLSTYRYESRLGRKGYGPRRPSGPTSVRSHRSPWQRFWAPDRLAWWVVVLFVAGSLLFVLGATASLVPSLFGGHHAMSLVAESCYTVGAVLYTISVYGQVLEYLNADDRITTEDGSHPPEHWRWWAWAPTRLGFLTPFVFLVGAVVFNYETIAALLSTLGLIPGTVKIGFLLGGLAFTVGSYLMLPEFFEELDRQEGETAEAAN